LEVGGVKFEIWAGINTSIGISASASL